MATQDQNKEHLGYLLTAYVFDNLSAAGRREVESHLKTCAVCRGELEILKATLGMAELAFDDNGKEYVFEERRRQRVLQAARAAHKSKGLFSKLGVSTLRMSWKLGALAASIMVMAVGAALHFANSPVSQFTLMERIEANVAKPASAAADHAKVETTEFAKPAPMPDTKSATRGSIKDTDQRAYRFAYDGQPTPKSEPPAKAEEGLGLAGGKDAGGIEHEAESLKRYSTGKYKNVLPTPVLQQAQAAQTPPAEAPTSQPVAGANPTTPPPPPSIVPPESRKVALNDFGEAVPAELKEGDRQQTLNIRMKKTPANGPAPAQGLAQSGELSAGDDSKNAEKESLSENFYAARLPENGRVAANKKKPEGPSDPAKPADNSLGRADNNIFQKSPDDAGLQRDIDGQIGGAPETKEDQYKAIARLKEKEGLSEGESNQLKSAILKQQQAVQVDRARKDTAIEEKTEVQDELNERRRSAKGEAAQTSNNRLDERDGDGVLALEDKKSDGKDVQLKATLDFGSVGLSGKDQKDRLETKQKEFGRKDAAIAAKDDTIRSQNDQLRDQQGEPLRRQNQIEKEKSAATRLNEQLSKQNEELADRDSKLAAENAGRSVELSKQVLDQVKIIKGAELGDHYETINPDKETAQIASDNPNVSAHRGLKRDEAAAKEASNLGDYNVDGTTSLGSGGGWGGGKSDGKSVKLLRPQLDSNFPASGNATISQSAAETALRAYRYFRAENDKLSFSDFLRRPAPVPPPILTDEGMDEDLYIERYGTRPFVDCARDHLSTFGLDVDTASYTLARSRLRQGQLPDPESVRVEEFLNYFKEPYVVAGDDAFGVFAEGAPSPFNSQPKPFRTDASAVADSRLEILKIGIKSRDPRPDERKPAMLTFVVDTSGSMSGPCAAANSAEDRLQMACDALKVLVSQLNPEDAVAIVGFSDQGELVLPRTQARQKQRILDAIDSLTPHGATNVESGLKLGYRLADEAYSADSVNRIILCSDGVANVGAKGPDEMLKLVKIFADRGIELSTVGFGLGKYDDKMMVRLADNGNGTCHFVDTLDEARKIFTEQLPPHLNVLARDAKAQVDFNPDVVDRYRLIGYEKRKIADKDFRNDKIDSGEVSHSTLITVLYEIKRKPTAHGPLGKVYLRWKDAGYKYLPVVERNYPLSEGVLAGDTRQATPQFRFTACVARFAELLRNSPWVRNSSFAEVIDQLHRLPADFQNRNDYKEVLELVQKAQQLSVAQWRKEL